MASKTSPQNIATAERRNFVLAQRKAGYTYRQIAAQAIAKFGAKNLPNNYGERYAHKDVKFELDRLRAGTRETTKNLVRLEVERLDVALRAIAQKVQRGNLQAVDRWVRLSETRRKLLGLDSPQEHKLSGTEPDGAIKIEHSTDPEQYQRAIEALVDALGI